jgi:hypothetical protein
MKNTKIIKNLFLDLLGKINDLKNFIHYSNDQKIELPNKVFIDLKNTYYKSDELIKIFFVENKEIF